MKSTRTNLRAELGNQLLPELRNLGFVGPSQIKGNTLLHEFRRPSPRGFDVLSVQLEKRGLPRFTLNLHVEPTEGIETVINHGGTIISGRLKPQAGPSTRHWFCADPTIWQKLRGARYSREKEAVQTCLALLPEVEEWWSTQTTSAHISVHPVTYAGRK